MGAHRARAEDVAYAAQVSIATVSLVVNGKADGRVRPETQERVWQTIRRLGYRVDRAAQSLSTGIAQAVALVVPIMTSPYAMTVAAGVAAAIGDRYQLLFPVPARERGIHEPSIERLLDLPLDGVISQAEAAGLVRELRPDCPLVALNDFAGSRSYPTVNFNQREAAFSLADYISSVGHTHVAYLEASQATLGMTKRRNWFAERLIRQEAGSSVDPILESDIDMDDASRVFTDAWPELRKAGITALVCSTDIQAYGVLDATRDLRLNVPGRLSVASFDDLPYSRITQPALTTVGTPQLELGHVAGKLLDALITEGKVPTAPKPLPTHLNIRDSVASPRG